MVDLYLKKDARNCAPLRASHPPFAVADSVGPPTQSTAGTTAATSSKSCARSTHPPPSRRPRSPSCPRPSPRSPSPAPRSRTASATSARGTIARSSCQSSGTRRHGKLRARRGARWSTKVRSTESGRTTARHSPFRMQSLSLSSKRCGRIRTTKAHGSTTGGSWGKVLTPAATAVALRSHSLRRIRSARQARGRRDRGTA